MNRTFTQPRPNEPFAHDPDDGEEEMYALAEAQGAGGRRQEQDVTAISGDLITDLPECHWESQYQPIQG